MRRFRFRLERLLAIRRYREQEWELALASATGKVIAMHRRIRESQDGMVRSLGFGNRVGSTAALDLEAIVSAERYRAGMQARIRSLEAELVLQEAELEKVRAGYLEASRRRKVLDKLKERQADAYRRGQMREQIAVLNEIATSRAVRWEGPPAEPLATPQAEPLATPRAEGGGVA